MVAVPERGDRIVVIGVLNVTPDSFSDGGRYTDLDGAVAHAHAMVAAGADLIDVRRVDPSGCLPRRSRGGGATRSTGG